MSKIEPIAPINKVNLKSQTRKKEEEFPLSERDKIDFKEKLDKQINQKLKEK